jgi:hypothetical protein
MMMTTRAVRTTATVRIAMMMRRPTVERTTVATVMRSAYTHAQIPFSSQVRIRVRRRRRHASPSPSPSLSPGPSRSTIPMRKKRSTRSTSSTSSMVTELGLTLLTRILRRLPRGSLE